MICVCGRKEIHKNEFLKCEKCNTISYCSNQCCEQDVINHENNCNRFQNSASKEFLNYLNLKCDKYKNYEESTLSNMIASLAREEYSKNGNLQHQQVIMCNIDLNYDLNFHCLNENQISKIKSPNFKYYLEISTDNLLIIIRDHKSKMSLIFQSDKII